MEELKRIYRDAAAGRIRELEAALAGPPATQAEAAAAIRRIAHSLRGSGATYGFPEVTRAAAAAEDAAPAELTARTEALLQVLREVAAPDGAARILAVDDDPEMQLLLRHVLSGTGREVRLAATAAEARAALAASRFDLVLLDLVLPDDDGVHLLEEVRAAVAGTPVVVLSGRTRGEERERCLSLGAVAYVEKPFDPEHLAAVVAAHLERRVTS